MAEGYAKPISVSPGDTIDFMISSTEDVYLTIVRLNPIDQTPIGEEFSSSIKVSTQNQDYPTDGSENGCGWKVSHSMAVSPSWISGLYAARCETEPAVETFFIPFVVKPSAGSIGDILVPVNLCTWNAYSDHPSGSKYGGNTLGSFDRPFGIRGIGSPVDYGEVNHLARAELWVSNWLDQFYAVDSCADFELSAPNFDIRRYRTILLNTHPEYFTPSMFIAMVGFLAGGGRLLYLAGNGMFERCELLEDGSTLRFWGGDSDQPRETNFFRNLGSSYAERSVLGVGFRINNYYNLDVSDNTGKPTPLVVTDSSHRFFQGTVRDASGAKLVNGDLIGKVGRNRSSASDPTWGAASGWEMDTCKGGTAPDGMIVNASDPSWQDPRALFDWNGHPSGWLPGHGSDRGDPPANIQLLARGSNSAEGSHAADMTYYDHSGGGFVFAVGSILFGGSLVEDGNLQQIVRNAIDDSLGWLGMPGEFYCAIWELREGPAWQARHGLTADQHQQLVNDLSSQGYRPTDVSTYAANGEAFYASIWEQSGGPAWQARHGLTADQHQQLVNDLSSEGYRPTAVSAYAANGEAFYASIWEQRDGPAWQARHGLTAGQQQQLVNDLSSQGYRPTAVSACANGEAFYASIWEQRDGPAWQARHGLTADQHQQLVNDLSSQGYRPTDVSTYAANGEAFYASIWEQSGGPAWQARHGLSAPRFQGTFNVLGRRGYRLICLSAA